MFSPESSWENDTDYDFDADNGYPFYINIDTWKGITQFEIIFFFSFYGYLLIYTQLNYICHPFLFTFYFLKFTIDCESSKNTKKKLKTTTLRGWLIWKREHSFKFQPFISTNCVRIKLFQTYYTTSVLLSLKFYCLPPF